MKYNIVSCNVFPYDKKNTVIKYNILEDNILSYGSIFTPLRQSPFLIPFPTSQARQLNILGRLLAQDCSP